MDQSICIIMTDGSSIERLNIIEQTDDYVHTNYPYVVCPYCNHIHLYNPSNLVYCDNCCKPIKMEYIHHIITSKN